MAKDETPETVAEPVRKVEAPRFSRPIRYLIRALIFLALIGFVLFIMQDGLRTAFMTNPGLNGLIIGALVVGILIALREIWRLHGEAAAATEAARRPGVTEIDRRRVISPVSSVIPAISRKSLSTAQAATVLESVSVRLDDGREILRYLAGLLVFLGLLGTFWGLLDTVSSVGNVIKTLRTGAEAGVLFDELKAGLAAPLAGMGLSFSSSLFGIGGSLVLGFLDLQVGQAQRRFRTQVEDWLNGATGGAPETPVVTVSGGAGTEALGARMDKLAAAISEGPNSRAATQAMANLAEGIQGLVQHMRSEQQLIRDWVEAQAARERDLKRLIDRLGAERVES